MKKTLKTVIISILIMALMGASAVLSFADYDGLTFVSNGSGYTVSEIKPAAGSNVVIPSTYSGLPVTAIGKSAARDNTIIKTVEIPASVTQVNEYAFSGCINLKIVAFVESSANVTLKTQAFYGCYSLVNLTLPKTTAIPNECFKNCSALASLTLPEGLTSIGSESFFYCKTLPSVNIPSSVASIGNSAFYNCSAVSSFSVGSGSGSFKSVDGVLYTKDGTELVQYPIAKTGDEYAVASGTTLIRDGAFAYSSLKKITLPSSVRRLGAYSFSDCSKLSSINFPEGLTAIGSNAFLRCGALKQVTLPSTLTDFEDAFVGSGIETVTLKQGITEISRNAFKDCSSLSTVNLPDGLATVGAGAFYDCSSISEIFIPASVTAIRNEAFHGCEPFTIKTPEGSYAASYAQSNSIPVIYSDHNTEPVSGASVKILGFSSSISVGYKTTVTFHASVDCSEGYTLYWIINNSQYGDDGSLSYTKKSADSKYTVQCKIVTDSGAEALSSVETVNVSTGIFAKIVYFFRNIFAKSSLIIDQK